MMKRPVPMALLSCLILGALSGCGDSGSGQAGGATATQAENGESEGYTGGLVGAKKKAVKTVDLASLTQAIQMFYVSEDRYPKDLQELVTLDYLREIPDPPHGHRIIYNPADGKVNIVAQ